MFRIKNKLSGEIYKLEYPVGFLILSGLGFLVKRGSRRSEKGPLRRFCCLHTLSTAGFSLGSKCSLWIVLFVILQFTTKREKSHRSDQVKNWLATALQPMYGQIEVKLKQRSYF